MIEFVPKQSVQPFLKDAFGRRNFSMRILRGGLLNQNYVITIARKSYLLKVYRPEVNQEMVEEMHRLMKYVGNRNIPVPLPIAATCIAERPVVLYPFIKGEHPKRYRNTKLRIRAMGELLGQLHSVMDEYDATQSKPDLQKLLRQWDPARFQKTIVEVRLQLATQPQLVRKEMGTILEQYEEIIENGSWETKSFSRLPLGLCHGDFHTQNILFVNNRIVGLLDWEKFGWNFRGSEIMRSVIFNCRKTACEFDWDLVGEYLRAYRQHATLSDSERMLVFEAGYRNTLFSLWAMKQYLVGERHLYPNIKRRIEIVQTMTKHRAEYGARISEYLS